MKLKLIPAIALAAFTTAVPASAQLLGNGDFEQSRAGTVPYIPYWTTENTGNPNSVLLLTGRDYVACCGVTGSESALNNQFIAIGAGDSPTNVGDRIYQTQFVLPGLYELAFDFAAIGGVQDLHYSLYDFNAASFVLNLTERALPSRNLDTAFSRSRNNIFQSTGGFYSVQFSADRSDTVGADLLLDNVSISPFSFPPVGGVPEPGTWIMLILGFGVTGAGMRRKQSSIKRGLRTHHV